MPYTPKKKNGIISKVKKKDWRTSHKYGVMLSKNVKESIHIEANSNTYWKDAIDKDMKKSKISYKPR